MSEWISVKDRLPKYSDGKGESCSVLCYITEAKLKKLNAVEKG